MKNIYPTLVLLLLLFGCTSSNNITKSSSKTILETHMDFNTSYYTRSEYEKKYYTNLHHKEEEIWGDLTLENLKLLSKNSNIKKSDYYRHKILILNENYTDIRHALQDKNYKNYMIEKDKTAKLALLVDSQNKAIVEYSGGDNICLWSTRYLLVVNKTKLDLYEIDGISGNYAPVEPL